MELSRLVELVAGVRATSRKIGKVALIADFLRQTQGRETALAALYLTGTLPQGRIGIGWRTVQVREARRPGHRIAADAPRCRRDHGRGRARKRRRLHGAQGARPAQPDGAGRRGRPRLPGRAADGRGAAGRARRPRAGGHRPGGRRCRPPTCARPRCSRTTSARSRGPPSRRARPGSRDSRCGSCLRSRRCSRARPKTWRRRSSGWARPPSSTRSTARASRSTRPATRCASSPASSRT